MPPNAEAYRRQPELIATEMDGEMVMMSMSRGEYFGLGGIGSRVWELLAEPRSFDGLVNAICAEYAVDPSTCRADLRIFVNRLLENELVVRD